ncbi:MAG: response regulator [Candidatus Dormibacteraeota bacterium]|nr:response regulator [Candidatus Dormibacteraeota bacterium]
MADDDGDLRLLIHYALTADGFDIVEVHDGAEALTVLESTEAAALVTDIAMPRLDGIGLVAALRRQPRTVELPVIVITGLSREEERMRQLERDAYVHVLCKPFSPTEIRSLIVSAVDGGVGHATTG